MPRANSAMTSMSQPNGSLPVAPLSPMNGIASDGPNEPRYEITPRPITNGQTQAPLLQSSEGRRSGVLVAAEMPSRTKPITIATISFQTTAQPENRMISLATTNPAGASTEPAHSRYGRSRSGSCRRSAPRARGAIAYDITVATEMNPTSCAQPGNGRKTSIPHRNENAIA